MTPPPKARRALTRAEVETRVRKAVRECVFVGGSIHGWAAHVATPNGLGSTGMHWDQTPSGEAYAKRDARRLRRDLAAHIIATLYPEKAR